jgi:peptidyl-tRNA hydrolase, PTH2 family
MSNFIKWVFSAINHEEVLAVKPVKQVIVVRTKYTDEKGNSFGLRAGKLIAQASHASSAFLCKQLETSNKIKLSSAARQWINTDFAKVCLKVETQEELFAIQNKAKENKVECHLITDMGRTEFKGVPTITCLALGPDYSDKIDEITKDLPLY